MNLTMRIIILSFFIGIATQGKRFEPTWESVGVKNDAPEWLQDAKFGIYTHWGVQTYMGTFDVRNSVWYYGQMYMEKSPVFEFHKKTFGDQNDVGYKDLIDHFKAKDFDAEAWADTFYEAGARFGGMVVIHRDNVAMWDSELTPYNVVKLGPKRDITGELEKAYRAKGMPFIATFHSLGSWDSFVNAYDYDAKDGTAVELYSEPHKKGDPIGAAHVQRHLDLTYEVIRKYKPDGIWFDYGLKHALNETQRLNLFADYYNAAEKNGQDVFVAHKHGDQIPSGILDTERGRKGTMLEKTWMNDESIGVRYWFQNDVRLKESGNFTAKYLTHAIIDLASKNGTFLLNVAPDMDGNIPPDQQEILDDIGAWLKKYGESIYFTRPWNVYGEGPFQEKWPGKISGKAPDFGYTTEDIRFTRSKDWKTVYAIFMGPPKAGIPITSMNVINPAALKRARWVGHGPVKITVDRNGHPLVDISKHILKAKADLAYAIAIPAEAIEFSGGDRSPDVIELSVDTVKITGSTLQLESIDDDDGIRALRNWKDSRDYLSWEVDIPSAGSWSVELATTARQKSRLQVSLDSSSKQVEIPAKGSAREGASVFAGTFQIRKAGSYTLVVKPDRSVSQWNPVDLYGIVIRKK